MSTVTAERHQPMTTFTIQPISYPVLREEIAKLAEECLSITVANIHDKANIELAHKKRMELVKIERAVEDRRVQLKADSLQYGRHVDSTAKELVAPIAAAKAHLKEQESIVQREQDRIKKEAEEERQSVVRWRLQLLADAGATYLASDVEYMPQQQFDGLLADKQREKRERDERVKAEADERARLAEQNRIEAERLAKERAEFDRRRQEAETRYKRALARISTLSDLAFSHSQSADQLADMPAEQWEHLLETARRAKAADDRAAAERKAELDRRDQEQAAAQAKIDAEHKRIFDARVSELKQYACPGHIGGPGQVVVGIDSTEEQFQAALAKAKQWKAEYDAQVQADAIAEQERKAAADKARADAEAAELKRLEELRPDREKVAKFAEQVAKLECPLSAKSKKVGDEIKQIVLAASQSIRAAGGKLK